MLKFIAKIFGTKSEKDIKRLMPLVEATKQEYAALVSLTNDALREKTMALKAYIRENLKSIDDELEQHHGNLAANPDLELTEKEKIFSEIDKLEEIGRAHV